MSNDPIYRPDLTAHVVAVAVESTVPVGRGSAPKEGGWSNGQLDSTFTDYAVVKAGVSRTPASGEYERLGRYGTSWEVGIQLIGHGETENRSDVAASTVVKKILAIDGDITLGGVVWTVQRVVLTSMGATEWSDQNKAWRVLYDVSLHLSRQDPR